MRSAHTLGLLAVLCVCLCVVCHDIPETPSALLAAMQQQLPAHSRARYNAELARASQRQKLQYEEAVANADDADPPTYDVRFMNMTLDHFNFFTSPRNFSLRYLWDDSNWGSHSIPGTDCKGPIFFYTGNEGDITLFFNNTGFLTNVLAPQFGALVVFAEHRYYGESMPFGAQSFEGSNAGYLTVEQALADYAYVVTTIKQTTPGAEQCPVVAFGGSYGGMLAAWMRLKYPNIIIGSLAASAPVAQFYGTGVNEFEFYKIATQDFKNVSTECSRTIRKAFDELVVLGVSENGRETIQNDLNLCNPLSNLTEMVTLYSWMNAGFTYMAMTDYPYPADFLQPMPGWPVTLACSRIDESNGSALEAAREAMGIYYNSTGQAGDCFNIDASISDDLGDEAWGFQACTEMVMPISSNGITDMFLPVPFELGPYAQYCEETYGVSPRPLWATIQWGGLNITAGSNIIFSNGQLDPWRGGGIVESSGSLLALIIEDGAHHLDLRTPNAKDPQSVINARNTETSTIMDWIREYVAMNHDL